MSDGVIDLIRDANPYPMELPGPSIDNVLVRIEQGIELDDPGRDSRWPLKDSAGRLRRRRQGGSRALIAASAALTVVIAIGMVVLLRHERTLPLRSTTRPAGAGFGLRDAFAALRRPRTPADVLPSGRQWTSRRDHVDDHASRLVFSHGSSRMWLVPGQHTACLVGTHGLGAGCTTGAAAVERGFVAGIIGRKGPWRWQGLLPDDARNLHVAFADGSTRRVAVNQSGAFLVRLSRPADLRYSTASGRTVSVSGGPSFRSVQGTRRAPSMGGGPPVVTDRPCHLTVRYVSSAAGTGDVFSMFKVQNDGPGACSVVRYPSVRLLGSDGRPLTPFENRVDAFGFVSHPIRSLRSHATGYFQLVFRPLNPSGSRRCGPAAHTAGITFASTPEIRVALPEIGNKRREPINPCPRSSFSVTRVTRLP